MSNDQNILAQLLQATLQTNSVVNITGEKLNEALAAIHDLQRKFDALAIAQNTVTAPKAPRARKAAGAGAGTTTPTTPGFATNALLYFKQRAASDPTFLTKLVGATNYELLLSKYATELAGKKKPEDKAKALAAFAWGDIRAQAKTPTDPNNTQLVAAAKSAQDMMEMLTNMYKSDKQKHIVAMAALAPPALTPTPPQLSSLNLTPLSTALPTTPAQAPVQPVPLVSNFTLPTLPATATMPNGTVHMPMFNFTPPAMV